MLLICLMLLIRNNYVTPDNDYVLFVTEVLWIKRTMVMINMLATKSECLTTNTQP
jgi:hypothetical protein